MNEHINLMANLTAHTYFLYCCWSLGHVTFWPMLSQIAQIRYICKTSLFPTTTKHCSCSKSSTESEIFLGGSLKFSVILWPRCVTFNIVKFRSTINYPTEYPIRNILFAWRFWLLVYLKSYLLFRYYIVLYF